MLCYVLVSSGQRTCFHMFGTSSTRLVENCKQRVLMAFVLQLLHTSSSVNGTTNYKQQFRTDLLDLQRTTGFIQGSISHFMYKVGVLNAVAFTGHHGSLLKIMYNFSSSSLLCSSLLYKLPIKY